MFSRSFRSLFAGRKNQPIVNAKKAPKAAKPRKKSQLRLEQLEDRVTPSTITQYVFTNQTPNNTAGADVVASTGPVTGHLTLLNMNDDNGNTTNNADITSSGHGAATVHATENTLRVRGTGGAVGNGWFSGAAQDSQGIQLLASTSGYSNIQLSFDWYDTASGIRDLQVQYTTDGTTWVNYTGPSATGTYVGNPDDYAASQTPTITVDLSGVSAANNDPNFGIRLVSAYDSTGHLPANTYAQATLSGGVTQAYSDGSGNWRFDNFTVTGQAAGTASTTTTISSINPTTSTAPAGVTFTANVSSASSAPTAGSVVFMDVVTQTVLATATSTSSGGTNTTTFTVTSTTVPPGVYSNVEAFYLPGTGFDNSNSAVFGSTVTVQQVPTITSANSTTFPANTLDTFTVTATGIPAPSSYAETGTLPTGVTFNTGTGVLSGTPTQAGAFPITFTATNAAGTSPAQNFTLTVTTPQLAPTFTLAKWNFENPPDLNSTSTLTGSITSGSASVTGLSSTSALAVGSQVTGAGIPSNTTILQINNGTSITLSANATATNASASLTFLTANNSPAPTVGTGTASSIGMNVYGTPNVGVTFDDVTSGVSGDTGVNLLADTSQVWRVRAQAGSNGPANGWSSLAPIGTQGAVFATSTVGYGGPINVSFDWYATAQGEANLVLEYTTDGTHWTPVSVSVPTTDFANGGGGTAVTNTSSTNTIQNIAYGHISGGQTWVPNVTATINDPLAANNPNFAIEMVNASTGADDVNTTGHALNNSSGNWRFDNVGITAYKQYTPGNLVILQAGDGVTSYNAQAPLFLNEIGATPTVSAITGTTEAGNVVTATTATYPVFQATNSGTTVTLEFNGTSPVGVGQQITISGVAISGSTSNPYNGTYTIQSVGVSTDGNSFTVITYTASSAPSGASDPGTGSVATDTYAVGQYVQISGVQIGSNINSAYNGVFAVTGVSGNTFTYNDSAAMNLAAGTPAANTAGGTGGAYAYVLVQQDSIPAVGGSGAQAGNQPITIDLSAAAGNGQLTRSADGSALSFDGIDSTVNNGGLTSPATPTGQNNRDVAVLGGNPGTALSAGQSNAANSNPYATPFYNSTTQGPFYVGDDNRGSVLASPTGPLWTAGHPNQAGGAVSQGVHEFPTEGPSSGTQTSASTNIRGINIGFDGRVYFSTASGQGGATILNTAGIFTDAQAQPTGPTPANDIQVVPALFGASKLGGIFFADVNGTGIPSNGDKLYFLDDGTVGGAGTGGIYVSTWNDSITWNAWNTPNNVAAAAAGYVDHWSVPVKIGDAPVQNGAGGVGQLRGLAGTVLGNGTVELYTTAYDNAATTTSSDNSIIQQWVDPNQGFAITSANLSGTTATITTLGNPNWVSGVTQVQIDGVVTTSGTSNGLGTGATSTGFNGIFTVSGSGNTWTYTDTHSFTGLATSLTNVGAAQAIVSGTIIAEANAGTDAIGSKNVGDVGLRGVAFAPVAATTVTLSQSPANPLTPGAGVTLTAVLSNPQAGVNVNGDVVTFIDQNTNTVLGQAIVGASVSNEAILTLSNGVVGNHYVQAYFAGGGTQALASARSNTIQIIEAGDVDDWVSLTTSCPVGAGVGSPVTFTATVNHGVAFALGANDTVSFYNGSVSTANLLGTALVNSGTGVATLVNAFGAIGTDNIIAVFNGDNNYESSQSSLTQKIGANASGTISSSANNVALNATPTFTATVVGNSTVGSPSGTVTFTLVSATTGAVVGTSSATALTGSGNSLTATWTSPALASPGSYFVTFKYTPGTGIQYNGFTIDTISSTNGTAFVETVKQAFTPGNLVAVQRGDGNINLGSSGYLVFFDEYTTGGALVQRVALPNLDAGTAHALLLSGQNGGEGLLNRSANGQFLTVAGYDVPVGRTFLTSTFPYQFPRTIALVDGTASVNTTTAIGVANPTGSGVPASIKSATATGTGAGQTVTITLNSANYFLAGQTVTIAGITDGASGTAYDGTFTVTASTSTTLSYVDPNNISSVSPTVSSATAASPASVPYNPTDVVTNDGQSFYLGSNLPTGDTIDSGILYVGSVGATTATEIGPVGTGSASIGIDGGQVVTTTGSGKVSTVGSGLPTGIGQTLNPLPSLAQNYDLFYHNAENAEQVLLLNTNDGSTINPNVAYIADQANGLLKFTLFSASSISLNDPGSGTVTGTYTGNALVAGQFVTIANASDPTFNGTFKVLTASSGTFTYSRGGSTAGSATGATATEWLYGNSGGLGFFGQKLVFAGGVTAVTGNVVNPGASAQVQLYVTGVNVSQQNPNQLDSFVDTNGGTAGFPSGNFIKLAFVGGTPTSNPASPNGNENFAGLAFAPGYVTGTAVAVTGTATAGYTVAATVTDPTGGGNVPTGAVYFYLDGSSTPYGSALLNGSGVATLTIAAGALSGEHSFTAVYQGDVKDDQSTGASGQAFGAGNLIATVSATGSNVNGAATSVSEFQTTGGAAVQTIYLPTTAAGELTLKGNSTSEGYVTDSADGHSASFAGYLVDAGSSTSGANAAIAVLQANGSVSTTTQIASSDIGGSVRAAVSADGLGFWVATNNYLRYVPFGNSTSTTSTLVSNYYPGPSTVEIQNGNSQFGPTGQPGQLYITGAAGSPGGGLSSIDGPAQVLGGLATVAGQAESTLGNGGGTDFNTGRDASGNFPASNQIAISPDGLNIFVADGRTDGSGGILWYADTLGGGNWTLLGSAQAGTGADSGLQGLVADFSQVVSGNGPVTLYATTTASSANRIVQITGFNLVSGGSSTYTPPTFTTLETAAAGTVFHGVAFAPKAAASTPTTTTTLTVTGSPGAYPGGVTLSATVTGSSPTGYVSFRTSTGVEIGAAPLVSGAATLTPSSDLLAGSYTGLVAVYTGDANNAPSTSSPQSATVNTGATTTALTDQFTSVATGVTDNLSAQVTFTGSNAAPTGTVTFWQDATTTGAGGTKLGTANLTATVVNVGGVPTLEFLASGVSDKFTNTTGSPHPMFAVYSGDANFATSTSASNPITVVLSPTITVTTNNANPANTGASVTETVTVTGSGGTPTGFVQFYDNLVPIGSPVALSGGTASVSLTTSATQGVDGSGNQFLLPGTQSITAVYSGDTTYFSGSGVNQQAVQANAFGAGDKFVYRVGDGINSLDAPTGSSVAGAIGSTIYIDEINTGTGNVVQSIILPSNDGTGTQASIHAIVGNGQQSTTEQLSVDGANSAIWLTGYDTNPLLGATVSTGGVVSGQGTLAPGIPTVSGSITRAVGRITTAGVVQDVTMSKGNSGSSFGNFNAVYSPEGTSFYAAGNGGVAYFSSFTPSSSTVSPTATMTNPGGTTTAIEPDGANLAVVGPPGFGSDGPLVYNGFPTTASSPSALPGFTDAIATAGGQASTFYVDAYFTHLDNTAGPGGTSTAPAGINTFYLSDDGPSFAHGAITKWSLVNGTWVVTDHIIANGTAPNPVSYYYISGQTLAEGPGSSSVGNVTLYVTYGNGGNSDTGPGQLFTITDNSGYDAVGLTAGTVINQTGTTSKETYRGVAMFGTTDLTGSATAVTANEGTAATNVQVATFTDPDDTTTAEPASNYTVTIKWGDGSTSAGTVTAGTPGAGGTTYTVTGTHTYGEDTAIGSSYPVTVTINDQSWPANLILTTTATVADATTPFNDITVTGVAPTVTNGIMEATSFTSTVATFTDPIDFGGSPDPATNYTATINWGDGTSSAGTIALASGSPTAWPNAAKYTVTGTHTYAEDTITPYTITVTVSSTESDDQNAVGTTTATVLDCGGPNDITGSGSVTAVEGTAFTGTVVTFTDPYSNGGAASPATTYSAMINWGDGSPATAGTVTLTGSANNVGTYTVSSTHIYAEDTAAGSAYPITVTILGDDAGTSATVNATATVGDAGAGFTDLSGAGVAVTTPVEGSQFTATVATFSDPVDFGGTADPVGNYTAVINWGDGSATSAGTIVLDNAATGAYHVTGTHTYAEDTATGSAYPISVTISSTEADDQNLVVTTSATVADGGATFTDLSGTAQNFNATVGTAFSGTVATFTDPIDFGGTPDAGATYTATINWGPGEGTSSGTVTLTNPGATYPGVGMYTVTGTHTYSTSGSIAVSVTISANAPETDDQNLVVNDTATVSPIQVVSVVVNQDFIALNGETESGNTVTATTDGNSGFTAGNQVVIAGYTGTSAGYNGSWTIASVSGNQFTFTDTNAGLPTLNFNTAGYAISANTTSALLPGGPTGHQRSMVDSIVYTFDTAVILTPAAVTLGLKSGVTTLGPATLATATPNVNLTSLNGGTTWVVTFSTATGNIITGHSIADGVYTINLNSADVTAVSGGSTMTTTRATDTFYRLFGDFNGSKRVNALSANQFNNTNGHVTGDAAYLAFFDFNGDGRTNATDANQFNNRNGSTWSGFTSTI